MIYSSRVDFNVEIILIYAHSLFSYTLMHDFASGRGPVRRIIHRRRDIVLQKCRHGFDDIEDLEHIVFDCKKLK